MTDADIVDVVLDLRVRAHIDSLGIPYEAMSCDPDFADTAAFCERYGIPPEQSANAIVVASRTEPPVFVACLVLATTRLDVNHALRRELGIRKLSFASAHDTRTLTGMETGGVTPFGLPDGLPLLVDSRVMDQEWIIVGGGSRGAKLKLPPAGLLSIPGCRVIAGLAMERD